MHFIRTWGHALFHNLMSLVILHFKLWFLKYGIISKNNNNKVYIKVYINLSYECGSSAVKFTDRATYLSASMKFSGMATMYSKQTLPEKNCGYHGSLCALMFITHVIYSVSCPRFNFHLRGSRKKKQFRWMVWNSNIQLYLFNCVTRFDCAVRFLYYIYIRNTWILYKCILL